MSKLTRRKLLVFFGASTAATVLAPQIGQKLLGGDYSVADAATSTMGITPVRLPHPLPIYQTKKSALPTGINQSKVLNPSSDVSLAKYTVIDDVVVPPEYERYVIVRWGDRVFPNPDDY
ncbi:MAG: DUF839 domain-containing protein, partial [Moorea sp. SIO3C2]|nr:DUF839 domain-containing protein [Moorena sp. SIO3C2]